MPISSSDFAEILEDSLHMIWWGQKLVCTFFPKGALHPINTYQNQESYKYRVPPSFTDQICKVDQNITDEVPSRVFISPIF